MGSWLCHGCPSKLRHRTRGVVYVGGSTAGCMRWLDCAVQARGQRSGCGSGGAAEAAEEQQRRAHGHSAYFPCGLPYHRSPWELPLKPWVAHTGQGLLHSASRCRALGHPCILGSLAV